MRALHGEMYVAMEVNTNQKTLTAVAMSGGVDSSASRRCLSSAGSRWSADDAALDQRRLPELDRDGTHGQRCCSLDDVYDAKRVAQHLGNAALRRDYEQRFEETWCNHSLRSISRAHPVPCTSLQQPREVRSITGDFAPDRSDRLATGHYARIARNEITGSYAMLRARMRPRIRRIFCLV